MYLLKKKENFYFSHCDTISKYISKNYLKKIPSQLSLKLPLNSFLNKNYSKFKNSPIKFKLWNFIIYYFIFSKKPYILNNTNKNNIKKNNKIYLIINLKNLINLTSIYFFNYNFYKSFFVTSYFSKIIKYILTFVFNTNKQKKILLKLIKTKRCI